MKSFIIATLIAASAIVTGTVAASADTLPVHGYQGTHYGR